jgi:protoporphyrinogen IX oxidase
MNLGVALLWLHISGNVVWIGSILSVAVILTAGALEPKVRGDIALRVYSLLSVPAFVLAFVAGTARLLLDPRYYFVEHHWMHGKLPFALAVIALHHVIGARAKKLSRGTVQGAGPTAMLAAILAASAVIAAFFAIFKLPN